jgi:hypothetical protein
MSAWPPTSADAAWVSPSVEAAKTQALFREVNERIESLNEHFSRIVPMGDWICECGDPACFDPISLTFDEYEAIRAHPARFPVLPGHELPEVEEVVEANERYLVVEKRGSAKALAIAHDPRKPA